MGTQTEPAAKVPHCTGPWSELPEASAARKDITAVLLCYPIVRTTKL